MKTDELPEELEELKLRLQLELDGVLNGGTSYSFQPSLIEIGRAHV